MPEPVIIFTTVAAAVAALSLLGAIAMRASCGRLAREAAAGERRRLARELHDGLTQELAFISMQARRLSQRSAAGALDVADQARRLDQVAGAADRALAESRELISALSSDESERLGETVAQTAETLAARHGAALSLDVDPRFRADAETGRNLLRILAQALANGLVHGRAQHVSVQLVRSVDGAADVRLRVSDNGTGFETDAKRSGDHFGLRSMHERAREIGAELEVRSRPGAGTLVEVVLPSAA